MSKPDKIIMELPEGFDPTKHGAALKKRIMDKYGPEYEVIGVSMKKREAYARLIAEVTQIDSDDKNDRLKMVSLQPDFRKDSMAPNVAAMYEDQMPGYYLAKFEPHIGRALFMKMSEDEVRCRGALAQALSCKPWDVMVSGRKGGGYDVKLPSSYVPSKHDDKLQEVAGVVVGRFGWYVDIDPQKLTARIVPADPPTFPPVVPFPLDNVRPVTRFDKAGDKEMFSFELAEQLGGNGVPNGPIKMNMGDSVGMLIVGLPGSGKLVDASTTLPVPVSERFPDGWARNDELEIGDTLYAPDGTATKVIGFSPWEEKPIYTVHFSDGQTVEVGGTHLWKARNNIARVVNGGADGARTTKKDITKQKTDALRAKAEEFRGTGAVGTLTDIARIIGYADEALYQIKDRLAHLGTKGYLPTDTLRAWSFCMDDIIEYWQVRGVPGPVRGKYLGYRLTEEDFEALRGKWMTGYEFVTHLVNVCGAPESVNNPEKLNGVAKKANARKKQVSGYREMTVYPVDETLFTLAEEYDARAQGRMPLEQIVSTQEMYETLTYGEEKRANWAVRVTDPIFGEEAELPIDPWLFGLWLGDGSTANGSLAVGADEHAWTLSEFERVGAKVLSDRFYTPENDNRRGSVHSVMIEGFRSNLRMAGVLGRKHIPALYRRASYGQRLAVLQGLMDADGTIDPKGACELTLSDDTLAKDALELIRSLGIKASMTISPAGYKNDAGEYVPCKSEPGSATPNTGAEHTPVAGGDGVCDRSRIHFTTTLPVFRMPRKAERLPSETRDTQGWNYITDITIGEPGRLRCIKVDHPEHLFLVEGFIPTHNSVSIQALLVQAFVKGYRVAIIDTPAKKTDYTWAKPYVHDHWWGCDDEGTSVAEALTVATLVDEEGKRMGALLNEHRVGKWQDLPEDVKKANPPVMVVADELASLLNKPTIPAGLTKEAKALPQFVQMAQDYLEAKLLTLKLNSLVAVHRAAGIREAYLTQRPSKTEGFPPELKSLIPHRMLLGPSPSEADIGMAFRDAKRIPRVPTNIASDASASRGAGIVHLDGAEPAVIKGYFAKEEDFAGLLEKYLGKGDPSDSRVRPTAAQIERCVPRADGESMGDDESDDSPSVERAPSGRPASQVRMEMGDTATMRLEGETDFEYANRMKNLAAGGGATRTQKVQSKEEQQWAKKSSKVDTSMMEKCGDCGGFVNPITGSCKCP